MARLGPWFTGQYIKQIEKNRPPNNKCRFSTYFKSGRLLNNRNRVASKNVSLKKVGVSSFSCNFSAP